VRHDPRVVVHVNGSDIYATAETVEDRVFRRVVFTQHQTRWYSTQAELDLLVETAPMIEIQLPV
jgi:hypothetical protein